MKIALFLSVCCCCLAVNAQAFPTVDYLPLRVDNSWTGVEDGITRTDSVTSEYVYFGYSANVVAIESTTGEKRYVVNDGTGLSQAGAYFPPSSDLPNGMTEVLNPPFVDLAADATLGETVTSNGTAKISTSYLSNTTTLSYTGSSTPEAFESVTIPAGTFTALRVEQELTIFGSTPFGYISSTMTQTLWLVEGVGLVKSETTTTDKGTAVTKTFQLSAYNVIIPDTTPDPFTIAPVSANVAPGAVVESDWIVISGIEAAAPISVTQGEYSLGYGMFTSQPGTVKFGDEVKVRQTAGSNWGETTSAILTIGGLSASFDVTTMAAMPSGNNVLYINSTSGYSNPGVKTLVSAESGYTIQVNSYPGVVQVYTDKDDQASYDWSWWTITFASFDEGPLLVGSYENAVRIPYAQSGSPGLEVSGTELGVCYILGGRFDVLEAVYTEEGQVEKFAVNFEEQCDWGGQTVLGQWRFNSSIPINLALQPTTTHFGAGWNLAGNSQTTPIQAAEHFGDASKVLSVWKWIPTQSTWAFYSPALANGGAEYAASKGFAMLVAINGGEGYWLDAAEEFNIPLPMGSAITAATLHEHLSPGWNLVSISDAFTPRQVNAAFGQAPPQPDVIPVNLYSLWTWDNTQNKWYYYSSALDAQGGTALTDYAGGQGYLDFMSEGKKVGQGIGFWVRMP